MDLKHLYSWVCLLVSIVICKVSQSSAKPTYYDLDSYEAYDTDRYDSNGDSSYALTYGKPLTDNRLKKLSPGYYYVDDGYIAPVAASAGYTRREDVQPEGAALPHNVKFTPIVRVRQTKTKRKKLFVPNFFG
ncbi:uncharacterized protein LOC128255699 [Drosophila gunungcola]|uniref:Uncharacterized protein n=1 Tax=Drosophila gunungcola TaxID=103775 RepID=A0A9Q0BLQ5_9MUSC|nr:uncharacterized protein LOC128255699 [Drosophila gunungcola]KAI8037127.1 hypothetical protein M5D96_009874 [Drosophila gunungcola]